MKIHSIHHRALTITGGALLAAGVFASRVAIAQDTAPAETPTPRAAPVDAPEPKPAPSTTPAATPAAAPVRSIPALPTPEAPPVPPEKFAAKPAAPPAAVTPSGSPGGGDPFVPPAAYAGSFHPTIRADGKVRGKTGVFRATVANAVISEEVSANPEEAARQYSALVAEFDQQRGSAAQAIFRLGESYRKLGRAEEARVQYSRILREFVDFPELTAASLRQLGQIPSAQNAPSVPYQDPNARTSPFGYGQASGGSLKEERALLEEELKLLMSQRDETMGRMRAGVEPSNALYPIEREMLQVRRQLLRLTPPPAAESGNKTPSPPVDPNYPPESHSESSGPEGAPSVPPALLQER